MKDHIVNPDSNLTALNRTAEYYQQLEAINRAVQVQKIETGLERGQPFSRKLRKTVLMHSMRRGEPRSKSPSPIRAAECFWPLRVFKGVKSVQNHETGLKGGQWLPRKLRITVTEHCTGEGEQRSKSASLIRAAECFRHLLMLKGVESVQKIETGLKGGQWLLRKLRITVLLHGRGEEGGVENRHL